MIFLPGIYNNLEDELTPFAYYTFVVLHGFDFLLFIYLLILVSINDWQIVYRQSRWRNLPFLLFYVFATLSIILRTLSLTLEFIEGTKEAV